MARRKSKRKSHAEKRRELRIRRGQAKEANATKKTKRHAWMVFPPLLATGVILMWYAPPWNIKPGLQWNIGLAFTITGVFSLIHLLFPKLKFRDQTDKWFKPNRRVSPSDE